MKNLIIHLIALTLLVVSVKNVWAITSVTSLGDEIQKRVSEQIKSSIGNNKMFGTFSDSEYRSYSNQFSFGQKVYVRISIASCDNEQKTINLLDSEKNKMSAIVLTKESDSPCVLSGSFDAPGYDGVFYLEASISSNTGTNFAGEMNINVGKGGNYVSSTSESYVSTSNNGTKSPTPSIKPKVSLTTTPIITKIPTQSQTLTVTGIPKELPKTDSLISKISNFFKKLFLSIIGEIK